MNAKLSEYSRSSTLSGGALLYSAEAMKNLFINNCIVPFHFRVIRQCGKSVKQQLVVCDNCLVLRYSFVEKM